MEFNELVEFLEWSSGFTFSGGGDGESTTIYHCDDDFSFHQIETDEGIVYRVILDHGYVDFTILAAVKVFIWKTLKGK